MKGLIFEAAASRSEAAPTRTDVACFIGYAGVRDLEVPQRLRAWLQHQGWWSSRSSPGIHPGAESLFDLPVPIDNWEQFDRLFAWDRRNYGSGATTGATYLGAAVRSFFAQGGRRCFVISLGAPVDLSDGQDARSARIQELVPKGVKDRWDRSGWHGLHHLFGLPEVSLVAMPDLAELASVYREDLPPPLEVEGPEPQFVECSQPVAMGEESRVVRLAPPRCTDTEYGRWAAAVRRAAKWLSDARRDVQLLAALPLPHGESRAARDLLGFMHGQGWLTGTLNATGSLATAFLQLSYPWLRLRYADDLPTNLEPPEGVMAGLLARNALTRGTFRSATALEIHDVMDMTPDLSRAEQQGTNPAAPPQASPQAPLMDRVSLFGATPEGIRLLSDVTTSNDSHSRQASINRTIALVMRTARTIGQEFVFEHSGERLWQQVEDRFTDVLGAMQAAGALAGQRPEDGFQVRCDRSTMAQQDIDSGRVIVLVEIRPAASIETMRIQLTVGHGGRVSLSALGMEAA
jgi:hypothetical protein